MLKLTSNAAAVAKRVNSWAQNVTPELARATLESATVLTAAAKREAPSQTGRQRRSISYQAGGEARYVVQANVPYDAAVQTGTRPHIIRPRQAKALFWRGAAHPFKVVHHPGTRANRYMQRAVAQSRAQLNAIAARAGARIVTR